MTIATTTGPRTPPTAQARIDEIATFLALLHLAGEVFDVCALDTPHKGATVNGYYTDPRLAAQHIVGKLDGKATCPGVYTTLNPIKPALYARAYDRLKDNVKVRTADADVLARRWLGLDFDVDRPADISADEEEHQAVLACAEAVETFLATQGWEDPIWMDSGNGAWLLYRLDDLPADHETTALIKRVLEVLAAALAPAADVQATSPVVKLDTGVFNLARLGKIAGTIAGKGDDVPALGRVHRRARVLHAPDPIQIVTRSQLEDLVTLLGEESTAPGGGAGGPQPTGTAGDRPRQLGWVEDAGVYLREHGIEVRREHQEAGWYQWDITCVWNNDHDMYIQQFPSGVIAPGCFHARCRDKKKWAEVRDQIEGLGWRAHRNGHQQQQHGQQNGQRRQQQTPPGGMGSATSKGLKLARVSSFTSRRQRWLWPGYLPLGELSVLAAPGSSGKTHINLDLAVRVAANLPLPGGSRTPFGRPANVLIVTSENDPERMLRPYLEATARALLKGDDGLVSACLDRIFVLQGTELDLGNGLIVTELLDLSRDRESFRATCRENDIKLTILDPLLSYTGTDVQTIDGLSVRRFLDPLVAVAREQQQTIVATIHFSKRTEGEFISRVMNSRQYTDCARSVLAVLVGLREDDGHVRRWLASAKNNLGPPPAALSFWIESAPHPAFQDEHVSTITWGQARDLDADELDAELKAEREAGRETTRHSAESAAVALQHKLLALWLATPPVEMVTSEELEAWRAEVGVSDRTWTKAKELVGVKTMSTTMRGKWAARLDTIPLLKGLARPSATE